MNRFGLTALLLCLPLAVQGQVISETPRAVGIFAPVQGYDDLTVDRFGTPASPELTELGLVLVSRMFRNTCLTLEQGAALEDAMPPGFAAYESNAFFMGTAVTGDRDRLALSATGNIDTVDAQGHPVLEISARDTGMTCRLEWRMAAPPAADRQESMAVYMEQWFPYEYALVRVERPAMAFTPNITNFAEWDRPCGDRWCPISAIFNFSRGEVILETTLNITAIGGTQP
ncbi:hypothetical protein AB3Y40_12755 [Yoonia sp. R2331]|uniref:hypothetical protein n=1 Tax=Yoonia sp. R2331 TaxID=3237238 RepID=UPI0034E568C1